MTDVENLTLTILRRIDQRVDRLADDMQEVKGRLGVLEHQVAGFGLKFATVFSRLDRMDRRLDRIERRLELTDREPIN